MDVIGIDDGLDLEQRVATMQANGLCLRCQRHDAAVVARQDADGLSIQAWVEDLLDRAEEAVAINEGEHGFREELGVRSEE